MKSIKLILEEIMLSESYANDKRIPDGAKEVLNAFAKKGLNISVINVSNRPNFGMKEYSTFGMKAEIKDGAAYVADFFYGEGPEKGMKKSNLNENREGFAETANIMGDSIAKETFSDKKPLAKAKINKLVKDTIKASPRDLSHLK